MIVTVHNPSGGKRNTMAKKKKRASSKRSTPKRRRARKNPGNPTPKKRRTTRRSAARRAPTHGKRRRGRRNPGKSSMVQTLALAAGAATLAGLVVVGAQVYGHGSRAMTLGAAGATLAGAYFLAKKHPAAAAGLAGGAVAALAVPMIADKVLSARKDDPPRLPPSGVNGLDDMGALDRETLGDLVRESIGDLAPPWKTPTPFG